jgi:hypothetical protein
MIATVLQGGLQCAGDDSADLHLPGGLLVSERAIPALSGLTLLGYSLILAADQMGIMQTPVSPISSFSRWGGLTTMPGRSPLYVRMGRARARRYKDARRSQTELRQTVTDLETTPDLELRQPTHQRIAGPRCQPKRGPRSAIPLLQSELTRWQMPPRSYSARDNHLISQRFGIYHTGVHLLAGGAKLANLSSVENNPAKPTLTRLPPPAQALPVLSCILPAPGRPALVESGYQIKPNQGSIINAAANSLNPYLALDVQRDPLYASLPGLEDTAAQLALPLVSGGRLFGILDLHFTNQSPDAGAATADYALAYNALLANPNEVVATYRSLADQVAIAIENAQLFRENQRA